MSTAKIGDRVRITTTGPLGLGALDPDDEYAFHAEYRLVPGDEAEYAVPHSKMPAAWHMLLARFGEATLEVPACAHQFERIR